MKYWSEILKKTFDTPEACEKAESDYKTQEQLKKEHEEARDARWKEVMAAYKAADEKLTDFHKDYPHEARRASIFDLFWV